VPVSGEEFRPPPPSSPLADDLTSSIVILLSSNRIFEPTTKEVGAEKFEAVVFNFFLKIGGIIFERFDYPEVLLTFNIRFFYGECASLKFLNIICCSWS
jgi:hypothetical protein